jgi:hypothetical protein
MRRHASATAFIGCIESETEAAAASLDLLVGVEKKRRVGSLREAAVKRVVDEVRDLITQLPLQPFTARQITALYYLCHTEVYGAEPIEMTGEQWRLAMLAAGRLIRSDFKGDSIGVIEFIRWVWKREAYREQRRKPGDDHKWRITWRVQFLKRDLLSDYRTDQARKHRSGAHR